METQSLTRVYDTGKATDVVKLAPSILAADFARLGEQVAEAEQAGADRIHVDVMDGHFVPNLSMGAPIVASLRRVTRLPLEIHLMISDPDFFLDEFVEAGSDSFLVHWEGNANLHRTIQRIKALGKRAAVVINPATPAAVLEEILQDVEQAVIMTVNPGFGHQPFIPTTLPKIRRVRQMIEQIKSGCDVEVDGASMQKLLRWRLPRALTFWWPEQRFLVKAKEWLQRWTDCEQTSSSCGNNLNERKEVIYATWNDWSWKDGGKHGAETPQRRPPVRSLQQVAASSERVGPGEGGRKRLTA